MKNIELPWNVLLPDPDAPAERIAYMTTTDHKANKPTRSIRLTRTRQELQALLKRAQAAECCPIAITNLRSLLGELP